MRRTPRIADPIAVKIAELIDREVAARCGPETSFEQRQEIAAAVAVEIAAHLAHGGQGPKAGG